MPKKPKKLYKKKAGISKISLDLITKQDSPAILRRKTMTIQRSSIPFAGGKALCLKPTNAPITNGTLQINLKKQVLKEVSFMYLVTIRLIRTLSGRTD